MMLRNGRLAGFAALLSVGCGAPDEGVWLEGFGYGWDLFNHRVSALGFVAAPDGADVVVVGGTSTTGINELLPETCDPDTCDEFPFFDTAPVTVDRAWASSRKARIGRATASVVATAAGASTTVEVPLSRRAKGDAVALIAGFSLDTDHPLSGGDACYQPRYGWLPTRMAIALGEPALADDGRSASVEVTATFEAGLTLEEVRACLDAVVDQAEVPFEIDVVVIAGSFDHAASDVAHGMTYSYGAGPNNPDPQPDPDLSTRPLGIDLEDPLLGWSEVDFAFHTEDDDGRGAYLRTLSVVAGDGVASGHATNFSPVTQQSGFDYAFSGRVVGVVLDGEVGRDRLTATVEELVDDAGDPLWHHVDP